MRRWGLVVVMALVVSGIAGTPPASGFGVFGIKQNDGAGFNSISGDGRYVAFETLATNLGPGDADALYDVYVRNTETGVTVLASRATGSGGAKVNAHARYPSISEDGRYVIFSTSATNLDPADTDAVGDLYVRDLVTDTTTLVSRATGAAGAKANGASYDHEISPSGRYVVFTSGSTNLSIASGIAAVYVRDLQDATTTLVSRVSGAAGAAKPGSHPSISADGRYVAFFSTSNSLDPADTDTVADIFVRDLQESVTTLVSRATGAAGTKGNGYSGTPSISADGGSVAFNSDSTNLSPDDSDTTTDVYVRDLAANTTLLASRATGAAGAKGNGLSFMNIDHSISGDGNRVVFESRATNLSPDDAEIVPDVYVRDLATDTTALASKTATGTNSNLAASLGTIGSGGRYVSFMTGSTNMTPDDTDSKGDIYVRDLDGGATYLESRCCPGYVRPKGATPVRVSLVPALEACASPNRTHGPPLAYPSCSPPQAASDHATIGTPDLNGKLLKAAGVIRYDVLVGNPGTVADEADVGIGVSMLDVRDMATLEDFAGELEARVSLRLTDRSNGAAATETGTMQDADVSVAVPCSATADTTIGATCSVTTSGDAVLPGLVTEGARAVWGLGQTRLFDGGPDADGDTIAGNTLFAVPGLFVP